MLFVKILNYITEQSINLLQSVNFKGLIYIMLYIK